MQYLLTKLTVEDLNAVNQKGNTALHWAALTGKLDVVQLLLTAGANPNAVNDTGATPIDEAIQGDHTAVCEAISTTPGFRAPILDQAEAEGVEEDGEEEASEETAA